MGGGDWGGGGGSRSPSALTGRIATRGPLALHPSGWCPELGQWEQGPQEAERRDRGMLMMLLVPLELSSEKRLDYEIVSLLPVWESKVVERLAREVPRNCLRARKRDCATAPWGELLRAVSLALCEKQGVPA